MTRKPVDKRRGTANRRRLRDIVDAESGRRTKSYDDYKMGLADAWKENPEFGNVMHLAPATGETRRLKEYLLSDKPLSQKNRSELLTYFESLEKRIASMEKHLGRPRRKPEKAPAAESAERNAAWLVAFERDTWRKKNRRERVPADVTNEMIKTAINAAANAFGVSATHISDDNIRSALKTGRIVVRY